MRQTFFFHFQQFIFPSRELKSDEKCCIITIETREFLNKQIPAMIIVSILEKKVSHIVVIGQFVCLFYQTVQLVVAYKIKDDVFNYANNSDSKLLLLINPGLLNFLVLFFCKFFFLISRQTSMIKGQVGGAERDYRGGWAAGKSFGHG